jgi:hypothetical protein
MTQTEWVHVLFGMGIALIGALALWGLYRPHSPARQAWPVLAFLIGFFLFIPVEAGTRTYDHSTWWETLWRWVPEHPATWAADWLDKARQPHAMQHKIGATFAMVAGVVEFLRARGRLAGRAWGFVFPALVIGVAIAFGVHGGTAAHLSHRSELVHHQLMGVLFAVAGVSLALVRAGRLTAPAWKGLWAALVLLVGLDITFLYRIPPEDLEKGGHHHESAGTR